MRKSINDTRYVAKPVILKASAAPSGVLQQMASQSPTVQNLLQFQKMAIQRVKADELAERAQRMRDRKGLKHTGMNLWHMVSPEQDIHIYLLGTGHSLLPSDPLWDDAFRRPLINFLQTATFTHIFTEVLATGLPYVTEQPGLADKFEAIAIRRKQQATLGEDNKIAKARLGNARSGVETYDVPLDDAYQQIAGTRGKDQPRASVGALETSDTRLVARTQALADLYGPERQHQKADPDFKVDSTSDTKTDFTSVLAGDQQALFVEQAAEFEKGRDHAAAEERNKQWIGQIPNIAKTGDTQLWIVGAAHIPGLVLRFEDIEWSASHKTPDTLAQVAPEEGADETHASSSGPTQIAAQDDVD